MDTTAAMKNDLEAAFEMMKDMCQVWGSTDDVASLLHNLAAVEDLKRSLNHKVEEVTSSLQVAVQRRDRSRAEATPAEDIEQAHRRKMAELEERKQTALNHIARMQEECQALERRQEALRKKREEAKELRRSTCVLAHTQLPHLHQKLRLHMHISKLVWDHTGGGRLKGQIVNAQNGVVIQIDECLNGENGSQPELMSRIWEAIERSHRPWGGDEDIVHQGIPDRVVVASSSNGCIHPISEDLDVNQEATMLAADLPVDKRGKGSICTR